jgi:hypothetical protein
MPALRPPGYGETASPAFAKAGSSPTGTRSLVDAPERDSKVGGVTADALGNAGRLCAGGECCPAGRRQSTLRDKSVVAYFDGVVPQKIRPLRVGGSGRDLIGGSVTASDRRATSNLRGSQIRQSLQSIARQILRKVLEGRLVFVPRNEGDEHWYEFSGDGSLARFFSGVEPLTKAMACPPCLNQIGGRLRRAA